MMFTLGLFVGFVLALVWHWYTLTMWSARIREACGGKIPGYDDDDDERNER